MHVYHQAEKLRPAATSGERELEEVACRLHTFRSASKGPAVVRRTELKLFVNAKKMESLVDLCKCEWIMNMLHKVITRL